MLILMIMIPNMIVTIIMNIISTIRTERRVGGTPCVLLRASPKGLRTSLREPATAACLSV